MISIIIVRKYVYLLLLIMRFIIISVCKYVYMTVYACI